MDERDNNLFYISAHFPPCAASGVFRTLGFIRHLVSSDKRWQVTVLALRDIAEEREDERLVSRVPVCVKVLRTGYFDIFRIWSKVRKSSITVNAAQPSLRPANKDTQAGIGLLEILSCLMKTPDSYIGWILPGIVRALVSAQRPDVIFATAPPFSALILGVMLKKIWRRPLVVDFRDPWVHNSLRLPRPMKVEKWDKFLELWVMRHADHVIMNTNEAKNLYTNLYNNAMRAVSISTIFNGFDDRFDDLQPIVVKEKKDIISVVHVGALYGQRDPAPLVGAMQLVDGVQIDLFGPGGDGYGHDDLPSSMKFHGPVDHGQAIRLQKGADLVLIIGNCQAGSVQIPAKLFEALALSRALWLIDVQDSPARRLLIRYDIPHLFCENSVDQIRRILAMLPDMKKHNQLPQLERSITQRFSRDCQAEIFAEILNTLAGR